MHFRLFASLRDVGVEGVTPTLPRSLPKATAPRISCRPLDGERKGGRRKINGCIGPQKCLLPSFLASDAKGVYFSLWCDVIAREWWRMMNFLQPFPSRAPSVYDFRLAASPPADDLSNLTMFLRPEMKPIIYLDLNNGWMKEWIDVRLN